MDGRLLTINRQFGLETIPDLSSSGFSANTGIHQAFQLHSSASGPKPEIRSCLVYFAFTNHKIFIHEKLIPFNSSSIKCKRTTSPRERESTLPWSVRKTGRATNSENERISFYGRSYDTIRFHSEPILYLTSECSVTFNTLHMSAGGARHLIDNTTVWGTWIASNTCRTESN